MILDDKSDEKSYAQFMTIKRRTKMNANLNILYGVLGNHFYSVLLSLAVFALACSAETIPERNPRSRDSASSDSDVSLGTDGVPPTGTESIQS